MPEKSKKEIVTDFLQNPENLVLSNREIAEKCGCDEGTVRRARQPDATTLQARIAELESELRKYRHNAPKPKRLKSDECPLWESPK